MLTATRENITVIWPRSLQHIERPTYKEIAEALPVNAPVIVARGDVRSRIIRIGQSLNGRPRWMCEGIVNPRLGKGDVA